MAKAKKGKLTIEDALVPVEEQPYEVPENWEWIFIENCCDEFFTGKSPKYSKEPTEYPIIGQQANQRYGIDLQYVKYGTQEFAEKQEEKYYLQYNDVLLNTLGTGSIGRSGIIKFNKRILTDGHPFVFRTHEYYSADLLYYYLQLNELEIINTANGSTNQRFLSQKTFGKYPIPLPPFAEQKRIVEQIENLFTKLDEAKEKAQEALDSFEIRRSAVMQKVIDEAVDKSKDCQLKSLSDISEIVSGFAFSSANFSEENSVPCIKITNVGVKEYNDSEYQYLPQDFIDKYERFVVREGDILISLTRSFINAGLKICRYNKNENALLNQRVALIRNCDKEYVYYYLQTDKVLQYVKQKSKTTNQPNLSIKDLNALKIPVLTPSEQKTVVRQLDATLGMEDEIKERIAGVVSRIDLMKKSILAKAFRGELGTNIADEESSIELLKEILN